MTLVEKKSWIQKAFYKGACEDFLKYISNLTDEEIEKEDIYSLPAEWLLWAVGKIGLSCSDEQFEMCGNEYPDYALQYCSKRLTNEQLERWGNESPGTALKYCSKMITDEQLNRWGNMWPKYALEYCSDRLTVEQLEKWGNLYPWLALQYCSKRLTIEQKSRFEKRVNNGNNCNI